VRRGEVEVRALPSRGRAKLDAIEGALPDAPSPERVVLLTPAFLALLAVNAAFSFAFATFFLLPKFLAQELGASPSAIGAVTSVFAGAMVLAMPVVGRMLDGTRNRAVLAWGCALMAASALGFATVDTIGPTIFLLRALQGFSLSMVNNAGSVMAADLAPPGRLAQSLGLYAGTGMVMTAVAPACAELLAERVGYGMVFTIASSAAVVAVWLSLRVRDRGAASTQPSSMWRLVRTKRSRALLTVFACAGVGFGVTFTFSTPFALEVGIANVRGFFLAFAVGATAMRLGLGGTIDRIGHQRVATRALLGYGACIAAMCLLAPGRLELLGAVTGLAHGLFIPAFMAFAVSSSEKHEHGKLMTLLNGAFNVGNASIVLLGIAAERFGYRAVFAATGTLVLGASCALHAVAKERSP